MLLKNQALAGNLILLPRCTRRATGLLWGELGNIMPSIAGNVLRI